MLQSHLEERSVVQHFQEHHSCDCDGHFIVPLPKKPRVKSLGESRAQAVRRHKSLEKSLRSKGAYDDFNVVMEEGLVFAHTSCLQGVEQHDQGPHGV